MERANLEGHWRAFIWDINHSVGICEELVYIHPVNPSQLVLEFFSRYY